MWASLPKAGPPFLDSDGTHSDLDTQFSFSNFVPKPGARYWWDGDDGQYIRMLRKIKIVSAFGLQPFWAPAVPSWPPVFPRVDLWSRIPSLNTLFSWIPSFRHGHHPWKFSDCLSFRIMVILHLPFTWTELWLWNLIWLIIYKWKQCRSHENEYLFLSHSLSSSCHFPDGKFSFSLGSGVKRQKENFQLTNYGPTIRKKETFRD